MIVAKMGAADMPVKVLGLEIERKRIGYQRVEGGGDCTGRFGGQVSGGAKRYDARLTCCWHETPLTLWAWDNAWDDWHLLYGSPTSRSLLTAIRSSNKLMGRGV